jgi:hypothetical protein
LHVSGLPTVIGFTGAALEIGKVDAIEIEDGSVPIKY